MKYLVYDLEIRKAILPRNQEPLLNVEYCDGWKDFGNMGISVLGTYISWEDRYLIWFRESEELGDVLSQADVMIGFNNIGFDNKVLRNTWSETADLYLFSVESSDYFDILRESWKACGLDPDKYRKETHGGFSLENFAWNNFGEKKRGHGAHAPILWQQGRCDEVINYCLDDVAKTRKLYELILRDEFLVHPLDRHRIIRY